MLQAVETTVGSVHDVSTKMAAMLFSLDSSDEYITAKTTCTYRPCTTVHDATKYQTCLSD